jgi:nuclear transport factor 2 (NTF2) superfamily protein
MTPDLDELRDFATRYTAAWCSQDPAAVATFFAEDGSLRVNDGAPAVGRAAIAQVALSFMTAFPDLRVAMDDLLVRGGEVEYQWTLTGTNAGRSVRISGVERWQFGRDGLIAASLGSFDAAEYHRQLQTHVAAEPAAE